MGQTLSSYGKNLQQGRGWKKILAIVPVPLLIAIIIILAFINPTLVFEPPFLLPTLNVLLLSLIPFSVAYLAWKSYAKSGALPLLFVGCGMVAFGYGSLVAGFTINIPGGTNLTPTIHNTGALIGAISFVAAALFALWKDAAYKSPKHGGLYLGLCYLAVLIFMSLFTLAALAGLVPPFFVQGTGPTVLRQVVLGAATVLFAVSTIIFLRVYFRLRYDFTYWFGLALALITIGLYAVFIQKGVGTMVGWAGRTAQYLGCIYLLIGIISTVRLSKKKGIPLEKEITKSFNFIEANYKTLVEMASDAIISVNNKGTILTWNPAAAKIFGYSVSEATGTNVIDFIFPRESALLLNSELQKLARAKGQTEESGHKLELVARRKTGGDFPAEVSIATEKVLGEWLGTFIIRDITNRKQAEESLRDSEDRYRAVFDRSLDLIYIHDFKGNFIDANQTALDLLGYTKEEIATLNFVSLLSEDQLPLAVEAVEEIRRIGYRTKIDEYRLKRRDGENVYIESRGTAIHKDGKAFAIMGIARDITERRSIEKALKESEALLQATGAMAKVGGWELDAETLEVSWTDETYHIHELPLGYKPPLEEAINYYHPDERQKLSDSIQRAIKSGEGWDMELRFITAKGKHLWVRSIGSSQVVDGKMVKLRGTFQDITERKIAEEKLAEGRLQLVTSNEELISALADKEVLLKEVHHRVKNNLMVVSSLLNLQMRRTTDQEAREALRESDTRIMSMAMIHEQVLQSGEYAAIDFTSYINDLVSNIRNSLAPYKKDVRLTVDVQPGIIIGLNQAVILGMIINEIASNSFKHAFQDCEKPEITISCRHLEDQVQVSIKDNGVGVPEETGIDNPSSLGLQLVNTLIKQLKGTIKYERDNGSKFTIMFRTKPESTQEVN